jgi:hypothetical protein
MRALAPALVALVLLAPRAADAGVYLGLRAGVAWPSGDREGEEALSTVLDFAVPFTGEVGWQFQNGLLLATYLRIGPVALDERIQDVCEDADVECGAVDLGLGLEAIYNFSPEQQLQPWFGGFVGWSSLAYETELEGLEADLAFTGWEVGVQGGLDLEVRPFTIGPFVQVGSGQFTEVTIDPDNAPKFDDEIDDQQWHLWTTVGVKFGVQFR